MPVLFIPVWAWLNAVILIAAGAFVWGKLSAEIRAQARGHAHRRGERVAARSADRKLKTGARRNTASPFPLLAVRRRLEPGAKPQHCRRGAAGAIAARVGLQEK